MAYKEFQLEELAVKVFKRKGSRSLRLSVTAAGDIRVSIPAWTAYGAGVDFARSRLDWIRSQLASQPRGLLVQGQAIGKAHRLNFVVDPRLSQPTSRLRTTEVLVRYPLSLTTDDSVVQAAAMRGCIRALRTQAEQLLPQRLRTLADQYGYTYRSVAIKQLKSRWGSCDHQQNITLNLFLMQLPWEYIDYVLLHELAHTKVLQHGPPFWTEMAKHVPNVKELRHRLRAYQPILHTGVPLSVS